MQSAIAVPKKVNFGKKELTIALTPSILRWCVCMSESECIYKSKFIEDCIISCYGSKKIIAGLTALAGGSIEKSTHKRWGEVKKPIKLRFQPSTIKILDDLSVQVSTSKSECVEYILRAIKDL
jgi:hypothetical protein